MLNDQMVDAGTVEETLVDFVVMHLMQLMHQSEVV